VYSVVETHHLPVQLCTNFGASFVVRTNLPIKLSENLDFVGFDVFMDSFLVLSPNFVQLLRKITNEVVITEFGMSASADIAQSDFVIRGLNLFKSMGIRGCWIAYWNSVENNYGIRERLAEKTVGEWIAQNTKTIQQTFIHGLVITLTLVFTRLLLDVFQNSFLLHMPPVGFAFFLLISYGTQLIIIGVLNIVLLHRLYNCEDWQIGFWLNGLFLLLAFSTKTLLLQTITGLPFSPYIATAQIFILLYPFELLGKFSNQGRKSANPQQTSTI
jgi:hypothetical protein